jgi:hypothetical protein
MRPDDLPTPEGLNLVWRLVGIEGIRPFGSIGSFVEGSLSVGFIPRLRD